MRLGSRDPSFLYHAGMVALRAGDAERAKGFLSQLVAQSPNFNPLYGPRARAGAGGPAMSARPPSQRPLAARGLCRGLFAVRFPVPPRPIRWATSPSTT